MDEYVAPTPDELDRVAAYWRRVEALACAHSEGVTVTSEGMTCTACGHAVRFVSAVQTDDLQRRAVDRTGVAADLVRQLDRGGVIFTTDGQRYEVRLHAHPEEPTGTGECVCLRVEDVALMLRATEGR